MSSIKPDADNLETYLDDLEYYEERYNPARGTRRARRSSGSAHEQRLAEVADTLGLGSDITMTYRPARYEAEWLLSSLRSFYEEELIDDVHAVVKGGKEASVYRCHAAPGGAAEWLAAKVYRPSQFRNLRNDAQYRQGRSVLTASGSAVKASDDRIMRALGKKTAFGRQVKHTSWLMYEYTTIAELHAAGAAVPYVVASGENAILMEYIGDATQAAPTLNGVRLTPAEARPLFDDVLRNIDLMLSHDAIHGDLSAYNILYWNGAITLIDFPQVTRPFTNPDAFAILGRDIERVCAYFARYGITTDAASLTKELWDRHVSVDPEDLVADWSRIAEEE